MALRLRPIATANANENTVIPYTRLQSSFYLLPPPSIPSAWQPPLIPRMTTMEYAQ